VDGDTPSTEPQRPRVSTSQRAKLAPQGTLEKETLLQAKRRFRSRK